MPKPTKDLTGQVFTRLTVLHRDLTSSGKTKWVCHCECGVVKPVLADGLLQGKTKSCGCYNLDRVAAINRTHGMAHKHPLYSTWEQMRRRCNCPTSKRYADYGGRGVTVDKRWDDFKTFLDDMGEKPKGTSIDRINNNKGYSPDNCRWATPTEQGSNTRRNKLIEFQGEFITLAEIAKRTGTNEKHLRSLHVVGGHSLEYALCAEPYQSKLNQTTAEEIRAKYKNGRSGVSLAAEYGVDKSSVSLVVLGKIWKERRFFTNTQKPQNMVQSTNGENTA